MKFLTALIEHFGYAVLLLSLMLELVAILLPGEFLMGYAGILVVIQSKLYWVISYA